MRQMTQFTVFLINKPGVLAVVTDALAKAHVNILALTLMDSLEHGVLRIVCENPEKARKVLGKAHDRWTETSVMVMDLDNEPGAFSRIAKKLADQHVNIAYAYSTGGAESGKATAVFKVADFKKAQKVLQGKKTSSNKDRKAARTRKTAPPR